MVTVEMMKEALEGHVDELRKSLSRNRKLLKSVGRWRATVDAHLDAARVCFDGLATGDPVEEIEYEPETGKPYVCIVLPVKEDLEAVLAANQEYYKRISRHNFSDMVVLSVVPGKDGEDG